MCKNKLIAIFIIITVIASYGMNAFAYSGHSTIDELYANEIKNGMFENDVKYWEAPNDSTIKKELINTHNSSAGAAHITQTNESPVSTEFEVRNNQYYHAKAYVKADASVKKADIIIKLNNGSAISVSGGTELIPDEWTLIEGDFRNTVTGTDAFERDDVYSLSKAYIYFQGAKTEVEFYLDDFIITKYDSNVNPNFQDENTSMGWENWSDSFSMTNIDKNEVSDLVENDNFPNVDTALHIPKNYTYGCNSPGTYIPVEKGEEYVVSAWYKILDEQEGGEVVLWASPLYNIKNDANMTTIRRGNAVADGKWHHIEAVFSYNNGGENFAGDTAVRLALYSAGDSVYSGTFGVDREFLLAELKVTKKSDLMNKSTLLYANTILPGGSDNSGIPAAFDESLKFWSGDFKDGKILYDENTDGIDIYNNSGVVGKFSLNGGTTLIGQNVNVKNGGLYDIDVMVMPAENCEGELSGNIQIKPTTGRAANISTVQLEKGKWTKISVRNREIATSPVTISLRISGGTTGDIYFGGFKVRESEQETVAPVINSIEMFDCTAAVKGKIPVIDVTSDTEYSLKYFYSCADSADSKNWTVVQTGHTSTNEDIAPLFAQMNMADKFIKLTVIPINTNLQYGDSAESNISRVRSIVKIGAVSRLTPESGVKKTEVTVKNTSGASKPIIVITAFYNSLNELIGISGDNYTLAIDEERVFSTTVNVSGEASEKIFICEGAASGTTPVSFNPVAEIIE